MKKALPVLLLLAAGLAFGSGCDAPTSDPAAGTRARKEKIGVALASMNHNFFIGMRQGVEDELRTQGFQYEIVDASDSATTQQQQVDQLLQKGVAAVIMVPVDAQQAVNPVKACNEIGVPILCIDRRVAAPGATVACTVETANGDMGEMAARHGLELLCRRHKLDPTKPEDVQKLKAKVVHLWGHETASSAQDRAKGFERVFNAALTPGVKVLKAVGEFNVRKSQEVLGPLLVANPDVELIFCHNDDNAVGALNAVVDLKEKREPVDDPRRIFIVGMDGNRDAVAAVRRGEIEGTVSQEPIEMGSETVRQLVRILDEGKPTSPYIAIRHHLLTRKEAEEKQGELWSDLLRGGL